MQFSECYYNTILYSNTVTTCTSQYSVDISVDSIFVFVPGVTRGNKDVGSVENCIFLFLLFVLIKGIRRQSEYKIPYRNPCGGKLSLGPAASYSKLFCIGNELL